MGSLANVSTWVKCGCSGTKEKKSLHKDRQPTKATFLATTVEAAVNVTCLLPSFSTSFLLALPPHFVPFVVVFLLL